MVYNKQFFFENLIHPWITLEELLESKNMTQKELAQRIWMTPKHITWIINWKNWISPELALKLEKVFWVKIDFILYKKWLKISVVINKKDKVVNLWMHLEATDYVMLI